MATALNVARYLIRLASPSEDEGVDCLCPMRLQKLLYYAQGWRVAEYDTPLFADEIQAWTYGPVVPAVYQAFKDYRYRSILPSDGADAGLSEDEKRFVASIWNKYKCYSATALVKMTHAEPPYVVARDGLPASAPSNREISVGSMEKFFSSQAELAVKGRVADAFAFLSDPGFRSGAAFPPKSHAMSEAVLGRRDRRAGEDVKAWANGIANEVAGLAD